MVYLITGGAGFIGSAVARLLATGGETVVALDKLTYAADLRRLEAISDSGRLFFEQADICDGAAVARILAQYAPVAILHLAAESHVDRSIDGPASFVQSNILGTYELLQHAVEYWRRLAEPLRRSFRFVHVLRTRSTEPLPLPEDSRRTRRSRPTHHTPPARPQPTTLHALGTEPELPVIVTNCSNNYGPYQFPEKLVPAVISAALGDRAIPVYGRGQNIRDWIHVEDHACALLVVARQGRPGERYNIGATSEQRNIDFVREICAVLDRYAPRHDKRSYADQISLAGFSDTIE